MFIFIYFIKHGNINYHNICYLKNIKDKEKYKKIKNVFGFLIHEYKENFIYWEVFKIISTSIIFNKKF